jgi:radical SAM superfamily enzyme YgiQ (UPF0313 family)
MYPGAVLIGFQDQTNLGLGYLASTLTQRGFAAQIVDFRKGPECILDAVRAARPRLVGFSLIFQYYLPQFAELAAYLRENGVACHFCAGGHYPTLCYEEMLQTVPELDSVVRCEGELTLAELVACLAEGRDWRELRGLAYRDAERCVATPPRPLMTDLDALPYPARPREEQMILGKRASPLLASRGCTRNCSFCSIRQFYGQSPGKKIRVRNPAKVAEEMRVLHEERDVSIFLFQDDDFPLWGAFGRRWVEQFTAALRAEGLAGRTIWKISCRADQVERHLFEQLREAGLYMVYLGLESGNAAGLRTFNKGLTVEDNLRAVAVLKELGLCLGFGFMLFDPSSTFDSVRANVSFLREVGGDGSVAAHFCRMVPYAGTPIQECLAREGRLRGDSINPDYDFLDARMDQFFDAISEATTDWVNGPASLKNHLDWAWQEYWVLRRLFPPLRGFDAYERCLSSITRRSNEYLLNLVEKASCAFERNHGAAPSAAEVQAVSARFANQLVGKRNAFIFRNQKKMLASLETDAEAREQPSETRVTA